MCESKGTWETYNCLKKYSPSGIENYDGKCHPEMTAKTPMLDYLGSNPSLPFPGCVTMSEHLSQRCHEE
jgi:hypothetical protein